MKRLVAATAVLLAAAAGCTPADPDPTVAPSTDVSTITKTRPPASSSSSSSAPSSVAPQTSGPTTAAEADSCPYISQPVAADNVGMRLERITVLTSGGKTVGCRLYALQGGALHNSEHLPGPNQPAIEITSARFASAAQARTAFQSLSANGTNVQKTAIADGDGVCFQTNFDPQDKGKDWACAFNVGATMVLVKTVAGESFTAAEVAKAVAKNF